VKRYERYRCLDPDFKTSVHLINISISHLLTDERQNSELSNCDGSNPHSNFKCDVPGVCKVPFYFMKYDMHEF